MHALSREARALKPMVRLTLKDPENLEIPMGMQKITYTLPLGED